MKLSTGLFPPLPDDSSRTELLLFLFYLFFLPHATRSSGTADTCTAARLATDVGTTASGASATGTAPALNTAAIRTGAGIIILVIFNMAAVIFILDDNTVHWLIPQVVKVS